MSQRESGDEDYDKEGACREGRQARRPSTDSSTQPVSQKETVRMDRGELQWTTGAPPGHVASCLCTYIHFVSF